MISAKQLIILPEDCVISQLVNYNLDAITVNSILNDLKYHLQKYPFIKLEEGTKCHKLQSWVLHVSVFLINNLDEEVAGMLAIFSGGTKLVANNLGYKNKIQNSFEILGKRVKISRKSNVIEQMQSSSSKKQKLYAQVGLWKKSL